MNDIALSNNLKAAIKKALQTGLAFYAYRTPDDSMLHFAVANEVIVTDTDHFDDCGFYIHPFCVSDTTPAVILKGTQSADEFINTQASDYTPIPIRKICNSTTSHEAYIASINAAKTALAIRVVNKVVISRTECHELHTEFSEFWAEAYMHLLENRPNHMVFVFNSAATGCWIGATPELFLRHCNSHISTMALAGTKKSDEQISWTHKETIEQQIVQSFVLDALKSAGASQITSRTTNRTSGIVEHICTEFSASIDNPSQVQALRNILHPTPAICGFPKETALSQILATERHHRRYYGGYIGPVNHNSECQLFVNLRSMEFDTQGYCIYAGGGIIAESDPEAEWIETVNKINSIQLPLNDISNINHANNQ